MVIRFPFEPKAEKSMEPKAGIEGKQIVYPRGAAAGAVRGKLSDWLFQATPSDYDIVGRRIQEPEWASSRRVTTRFRLFNFWSPRNRHLP